MDHYRRSLERFIQEEGKEWESTREPGQTHTLDTMAIASDVDEQIAFREYFLMQAHTMHNRYTQRKAHILETGTPTQIHNFLCANRPNYQYHATRVILTSEALQEAMDTLTKLQKELARVLNVIPPLPPIPAETTYNIKCTPPIKGHAGEDRRKQRTQSGQTIRFSIAFDRSIHSGET